MVVNVGFSWEISKKSFSGKGPGQGVLGISYTQSVALGWGGSPIGGLWNLIVSSSSARIHTPGMVGPGPMEASEEPRPQKAAQGWGQDSALS